MSKANTNTTDPAVTPDEGGTTTPTNTTPEVPSTPKATAPTAEKTVKIRLPRERKDQEDVFVSINERTWLIKRGVEVEVPECVAALLHDQEHMLEQIMEFEEVHAE